MIESFNGSVRAECLNENWFLTLDDGKEKIEAWRVNYNEYRPLSVLGNLARLTRLDEVLIFSQQLVRKRGSVHIQQAILQFITPIFDLYFTESSFGFRPKLSAHGASKQIKRNIRDGYRHCMNMDLSKFFDRVQHDVLLARVARRVDDRGSLKLIGRFLLADALVDRLLHPSQERCKLDPRSSNSSAFAPTKLTVMETAARGLGVLPNASPYRWT